MRARGYNFATWCHLLGANRVSNLTILVLITLNRYGTEAIEAPSMEGITVSLKVHNQVSSNRKRCFSYS